MAYITPQRKADVESDLAATLAFIAWLDSNITNASTTGRSVGTKRYDLDSGTGRQSETFNSPMELIDARKTKDLNIINSKQEKLDYFEVIASTTI